MNKRVVTKRWANPSFSFMPSSSWLNLSFKGLYSFILFSIYVRTMRESNEQKREEGVVRFPGKMQRQAEVGK